MTLWLLHCGMRLSELVSIDLSNVREEEQSVLVFGKGRKERKLYLNDRCMEAYHAYLEQRGNLTGTVEKALFVSHSGTRITGRRVEQIIEAALDDAGLGGRGYSPHKLRHTAATNIYRAGGDVLGLMQVLGHENLATTQIYTHISDDSVKELMGKNKY